MGESLTQRRPVTDEGQGCKRTRSAKTTTVAGQTAPANLVPAAAVIRGGRVLFALTGRTACVGGPHNLRLGAKTWGANRRVSPCHWGLWVWQGSAEFLEEG